MSKISWQTGNLNMNEDLVNHSTDPLYYLTHRLDISQTPRETKQELINLKNITRNSTGYALFAERIWEEDTKELDWLFFYSRRNQKFSKESIRIFGLMQKLGKTFKSFQVDIIYGHYIEPRVQWNVPRQESYRIPLNYADLEIAQENEFMTIGMSTRTETCQIRGRVSQDFRHWTKLSLKGCNQFGEWQEFGKQLKEERNKNKRIEKLLFHAEDRIPKHAYGKRCSKITSAKVSEEKFTCIDFAGERRNSV